MKEQRIERQSADDALSNEVIRVLAIQVPGDKAQTVEDVKKCKSELEEAITALIRNFQLRTKCEVAAIERRQAEALFYKVRVVL